MYLCVLTLIRIPDFFDAMTELKEFTMRLSSENVTTTRGLFYVATQDVLVGMGGAAASECRPRGPSRDTACYGTPLSWAVQTSTSYGREGPLMKSRRQKGMTMMLEYFKHAICITLGGRIRAERENPLVLNRVPHILFKGAGLRPWI